LVYHPLALRCEIRSRKDVLAAARRGDRCKEQVLRDNSHSPQDSAARVSAKETLPVFQVRYRTAVTAFM
jgi:hypothetical protein